MARLAVRFRANGGLGQIAGKRHKAVGAASTKFRSGGGEDLGIATGDDNPGAFVQEDAGNALSNPTRGAGYKNDFVIQCKVHLCPIYIALFLDGWNDHVGEKLLAREKGPEIFERFGYK
jgi:hypothetical protein